MEGKIFISYRRADTGPYAQLVYGGLEKHFGEKQIFLDVDEINPGQDFVQVLDNALNQCGILIVMIGPDWIRITDSAGARRLDDPQDFVRLEVATALKRKISVVPVLVNNATMPGEDQLPDDLKLLARQQAFKVGERVNRDVEADLVPAIRKIIGGLGDERRLRLAGAKELDETRGYSQESYEKPHVMVVMPFGKKKGGDGSLYDFNAIYRLLIRPALEEAGFEPFRADEETTSGDIMTDMLQELLLADLVVADLSIDNANVFYELGMRHSLRKRGLVHVNAGRAYMSFEVFNLRSIPYHITDEGVPDPLFLDKDKMMIARACRDTYTADRNVIHSPVFDMLNRLPEPDRKALWTSRASGFWREYTDWKERVTAAQKQNRLGDILLLTEEVRNPLIKEEVIEFTGTLLRDLGYYTLALLQFQKGLQINPMNKKFRREEALHLFYLGRIEAIARLEGLIQDNPGDLDAVALLGRIYKNLWVDSWMNIPEPKRRVQEAYFSYPSLIKAIDIFLSGYDQDQNNWQLGGQALLWISVLMHLADLNEESQNPEVQRYQSLLAELRGAVLHAMKAQSGKSSNFDAQIAEAEVNVVTAVNTSAVSYTYRKSLAYGKDDPKKLASALQSLETLSSLDYRPEFVGAGLVILKEAMEYTREVGTKPRNRRSTVLLFAGHMVDSAFQDEPLFPADMESEVRERICDKLDELKVDESALAIQTSIAAGADIIFAEECLKRNLHLEILLPCEEDRYIEDWIAAFGSEWRDRYNRIRNHPDIVMRHQSEDTGLPKMGGNFLKRNNKWGLYSAVATAPEIAPHLIAVWNGNVTRPRRADEYLIQDIVQLAQALGIEVDQINIKKFNYWKSK